MNEHRFKVDSQKTHSYKLRLGVLIGIGMMPLMFRGLDLLKGRHRPLMEWTETWWPVGLVIALIGIAGAVYVQYFYHSTVTITEQHNLGLQISIQNPGSTDDVARGTWKWYASYNVVTLKYGMKKKTCQLILLNRDKAFCIFRQDFGEFTQQPAAEFVPHAWRAAPQAPIYVTKNLNEILHIVAGSRGAEQVVVEQKKIFEEVVRSFGQTHAKTTKTVDKQNPEYGDPDYDL